MSRVFGSRTLRAHVGARLRQPRRRPAARAPPRHRQPARHVGSGGRDRWRASGASSRSTSRASPAPRPRPPTRRPTASRRACERWFAEQGLERPHVAGNSLGGGIALELARRRRRRLGHRALPRRLLDPARARLRPALAARVARDRQAPAARDAGADPHGRRARRALLADLRPTLAPAARRRAGRDRRLRRRPRPSTPRSTASADYRFSARRRAARRAGDDRVGHARLAAHPAPGRSGRGACCRGRSTSRCAAAGTCRVTTTPRRSRRCCWPEAAEG